MESEMKKFIVIIVLLFTGTAWATVVVTSKSGNITNGSTVVISGTGFGTKSPANPYLWADFNTNINPTNLGRHTSWDNTEYVKYQAGCGPDSSGCALDDNAISGEGPMGLITTTGDFGAGAINTLSQKSYVYRKQKHNFNVSTYNLKTFRLWPLNAGTGPNNYINEGNSSSDCEGCDNYCWALNNDWASNTNWYTQEIVMQANSTLANTGDGVLKVYNDSTLWYNCGAGGDGSHSWAMRCTANNYDERDLYFVHAVIANTPTWNGSIHFYYDDIYVDDTWSRVMICSGSTWANRGHCEIQIPSAWSTTQATVTINVGTLTGSNYLYVVDSTNSANSSGYSVTVGSVPNVNIGAPSAPQNVTIGTGTGNWTIAP
jgi:hypothetical protein